MAVVSVLSDDVDLVDFSCSYDVSDGLCICFCGEWMRNGSARMGGWHQECDQIQQRKDTYPFNWNLGVFFGLGSMMQSVSGSRIVLRLVTGVVRHLERVAGTRRLGKGREAFLGAPFGVAE